MNLKTQRNILAVTSVGLLVLLGVLAGTGALSGAAGGQGKGKGVGSQKVNGKDVLIVQDETILAVDPASPGTSVVGTGTLGVPGMTIENSGGNDVVAILDNVPPILYGANNTIDGTRVINAANACSIPGAFADVGSADGGYAPATKKHEYVFTFDQSISKFKIGVLDWGDYMAFGVCPELKCSMVMTAYNAQGEVVAQNEKSFTLANPSQLTAKRDTVEYGNTGSSGDACDAQDEQPGRFTLQVNGPGIVRVTLNFANRESTDPQIALWTGPMEVVYAEGTGTIGYWMNRGFNIGWPLCGGSCSYQGVVLSQNGKLVVGGVEYEAADAQAIMNDSGSGDYSYQLFQQLAGAKLNMLAGNDGSCIIETVRAADEWFATHTLGSGADSATDGASELNDMLTAYNEGQLCAPHRDS